MQQNAMRREARTRHSAFKASCKMIKILDRFVRRGRYVCYVHTPYNSNSCPVVHRFCVQLIATFLQASGHCTTSYPKVACDLLHSGKPHCKDTI